jgi:hypothetical protein
MLNKFIIASRSTNAKGEVKEELIRNYIKKGKKDSIIYLKL